MPEPVYCVREYGFAMEPEFTMRLPKGAKLLRAAIKKSQPVLWALVDKNAELEDVDFLILGPQDEFAEFDCDHVSSFLAAKGGNAAVHLFVHRPPAPKE